MPQNHRGQEVRDNHFNSKVEERAAAAWKQVGDGHHSIFSNNKVATVGKDINSDRYNMSVQRTAGKGSPYLGAGQYRTEERAKKAAEGLMRRHDEGRDLQTGKADTVSTSYAPKHDKRFK